MPDQHLDWVTLSEKLWIYNHPITNVFGHRIAALATVLGSSLIYDTRVATTIRINNSTK